MGDSAIDRFQNDWLKTLIADSPLLATSLGVDQHQDVLGDFSPEQVESKLEKLKIARLKLQKLSEQDRTDLIGKHAMLEDFDSEIAIIESGLPYRDLNNIASPVQEIRNAFDLMGQTEIENWQNISSRMKDIHRALQEHSQTLSIGIQKGSTPAKRQIQQVIKQIPSMVSFFEDLAKQGSLAFPRLESQLSDAAVSAKNGLAEYAEFLSKSLYPKATDEDAVGTENYQLLSRKFLGLDVDLEETYEWGLNELARVISEQEEIAKEILPSSTVQEAIELIDKDPRYKINGVENLRSWMQETSDEAIAKLAGVYFDIPDELRALECRIAPTDQGGIYYTQPSEDFSRPGRMWWSIPSGVNTFSTWREKTTVYHEGVPGHHLQLGWQVYNQELNDWRRNVSWTSGHGEGWALYAEQIMQEFGFLSDPADLLGMLDAQRMRAARVVLDIGVHLGKTNPDGGKWNYDYALGFMRKNVSMNEKALEFEVNRYFGWPGQAPSYKIGQRILNELRSQKKQQLGSDFDLKEFHSNILRLGGLGLSSLKFALS
jgi:uncharacterized protein (DUF885 family)